MHVMVDTRTNHVRGTAAEWNIVVYMPEKRSMSSNNSVHSMSLILRKRHAAAHGNIFCHAVAQAKCVTKSFCVAKYMYVPKSCSVAKID